MSYIDEPSDGACRNRGCNNEPYQCGLCWRCYRAENASPPEEGEEEEEGS
jgi:hypothetical protein